QARAIEQLAKDAVGGLCIDLAEIDGTATAARTGGGLDDAGLERFTTREPLEQGQRIARRFVGATAGGGGPARPARVRGGIARVGKHDRTAPQLDPQQAHAAALIAGSERAVVLVGPAGAGKTTTLQVAVEALHQERRCVVGLAPMSVAAKRLADSTGLPCEN